MTCIVGEKIHPRRLMRTREILNCVIVDPPVTIDFLQKPPFWYVHQMVKSVIRATGFMEGLFSEKELSRDIVQHRDMKINFLQKVIDMLELVHDETLYAKPTKIIRGTEVVNTLELFQYLGLGAMMKINNKECVRRVLLYSDNRYSERYDREEERRKRRERLRRRSTSEESDSDGDRIVERWQQEKEDKMVRDRLARVAGKGRYAQKKDSRHTGRHSSQSSQYKVFNY